MFPRCWSVSGAASKKQLPSGLQSSVRCLRGHAPPGKRQHVGRGRALDTFWLALGRGLIFRKIRERFGTHLRALICGFRPGSAPETQQFFLMLGIPVLQAYGLTETTGICTLDDPRVPVEAGLRRHGDYRNRNEAGRK